MADLDDDQDFLDFLKSTEADDDDDVETSQEEDENLTPDPKDPKNPKKPSDDSKKEDDEDDDDLEDDPKKPKKDPAKKPKSDKGDDEESDEDEEEEPEKPAAAAYKPRLSQFFNDDGTTDLKKIEEAYIASSKEGVRLNEELEKTQGQVKQLLSAIAADPEAAKKILGEEGAARVSKDGTQQQPARDPIMADYEAKMTKQSRKEYDDFVENHPEAVSDPEKARKISGFIKFYGPWYQKENDGEIAGMKDTLEAAYRHFGWDLEIDKAEGKATAAKKNAATRSTPKGGKKGGTANQLTKAEQQFAKKLNVKL